VAFTGKENNKVKEESGDVRQLKILIGWLVLSDDEVVGEVRKWLGGVKLDGAEWKAVAWLVNNGNSEKEREIINRVPAELRGIVEEVLMMPEMEEKPERKAVLRLTGKILREYLERTIDRLKEEIEEAEKAGKGAEADEKYAQVAMMNKKISETAVLLA